MKKKVQRIKKSNKKKTTKKPKQSHKPIIKTYTKTIIASNYPIINETEKIQNWNIIRKYCEGGIKFYRDYHEIKPCDSELARRLNEIESFSKLNHMYPQIMHILRSKQTQIDKLRQIYRYSNSKLV